MKKYGWLLVSLLALTKPVMALPDVNRMIVKGQVLHIKGRHFGNLCNRCEVIANFSGFRYSLQLTSWADSEITAQIADIGRGTRPVIQVVTPDWRSKSVKVRVNQRLIPPKRPGRFVKNTTSGADYPTFSRRYDSSLGGKGEEIFEFDQLIPACGSSGAVFDSAEVLIGRRTRFGEARITSLPRVGCERCKVGVGYYWEPTGRLDFQLHIYQREVEGICRTQIR